MLVDGFKNTLLITICALAIGVAIGTFISVIKFLAEENKWFKPLEKICNFYVTVIRGVPVVVLLLIFYFVIMRSADGITTAIIAFGINSGAYMAEIIRGGIGAVDGGQTEAARSLGMNRLGTMGHIILPQAVKHILPAVGNEMIALLKETSVAGYVAVQDLTRAANLIRNNTFDAFNPLMATAIVYLSLVIIMTHLLGKLERKLRQSDIR
ncbi:MAG: amino acid ABC transporter permease [Oscillospiraceae bacterium]|nr:amino acid ABC transporter permease [Oscillospiraceae bacterium]MBQ5749248.1 amino acid ABC transporter permease [Oscillospiraceae bacterium]